MTCVCIYLFFSIIVFFFKQKTAYEMRISDWSSDVCSSDLLNANGYVSGFEQNNDGTQSDFIVQADKFMVAMPGVTPRVIFGEIGRASCRERSVSVRVDLGGRRIIKKKKNETK